MKCPIDNVDLMMSERSGVEIDYCPTCRGVWLDRGELDKILDRAAALAAPERPHAPSAPPAAPPLPSPMLNQPPRPQRGYGSYDDERQSGSERNYGGDYRRRDNYRGYDSRGQMPHRKKKDNWLGELFDF